MQKAKVGMESIPGIRFNRMPDRVRKDRAEGKNSKALGRASSIKEAEIQKIHYDKTVGCFIPAQMFKSALKKGCKIGQVKHNKSNASQYIDPLVFITPIKIPLLQSNGKVFKKCDEVLEEVILKKDGNAVVGHFPTFNIWKAEMEITLTDDDFPIGVIQTALEQTGLLVGLGNRSPIYGRFIVIKFEVEK